MDVEFINAYIAKQKSLIDDFQTKLLILEVKNAMLEQQLASLKTESTNKKSSKASNE